MKMLNFSSSILITAMRNSKITGVVHICIVIRIVQRHTTEPYACDTDRSMPNRVITIHSHLVLIYLSPTRPTLRGGGDAGVGAVCRTRWYWISSGQIV